MPTGYTAKLYEGKQSFKDFVFGCAKAFCWAFKEASPDVDYEETVEAWFREDIRRKQRDVREQEKRVEEAKKMTLGDAKKALQEQYERSLAERNRLKPQYDAREKRFHEMRNKVIALRFKKEDEFLLNLRKFMLEQLSHDCHPEQKHYYSDPPKPYTDKDAEEYVMLEKENAIRCRDQARNDLAELIASYEEQKKRVKQLKLLVEQIEDGA